MRDPLPNLPRERERLTGEMEDSLHHEILLALSGYPGNAFRVSQETSTIEVVINHDSHPIPHKPVFCDVYPHFRWTPHSPSSTPVKSPCSTGFASWAPTTLKSENSFQTKTQSPSLSLHFSLPPSMPVGSLPMPVCPPLHSVCCVCVQGVGCT